MRIKRQPEVELPPNRLRRLSEEHGLKPYDLAARFRVEVSTIYRWEAGTSPVPDDVKLALAELFEVTPAFLMGWDGDRAVASA